MADVQKPHRSHSLAQARFGAAGTSCWVSGTFGLVKNRDPRKDPRVRPHWLTPPSTGTSPTGGTQSKGAVWQAARPRTRQVEGRPYWVIAWAAMWPGFLLLRVRTDGMGRRGLRRDRMLPLRQVGCWVLG